ncbi:B-cell antigen receptor complex-associated protein alpha chain [Menidia menidia]|uniref:(Atlantic silverside) hypothetical protein n=1 Tax=Menidia menidia TaxID=238744 RepID=A0A8S4BK61_9TELE|nr:unnamed protein product [Menidia menidia]
MGISVFFVFCSLAGHLAQSEVILQADRPFLRVAVSDKATIECCYKGEGVDLTWEKRSVSHTIQNMTMLEHMNKELKKDQYTEIICGILTFQSVQENDTGLYQCSLRYKGSGVLTHGTYLQVYRPLEKTINLSEATKNTILTVEGVLLLLSVMMPSMALLFKSRSLKRLEMKKIKQEEENIYQGLNLDDCCTTYDQIERSMAQGPYQDVGNMMEEKEEIQLEKP